MAVFPDIKDTIPVLEPLSQAGAFKTLVSTYDDAGEEKRRRKWLYVKRSFTLKYKGISKANGRTLYEFFCARYGRYEAFSFFYPFSETYTGEYVGTGDASTVVWNLPSKTASSYTLYKNGAALTAGGVDWTFASGGGADGADKATLATAPASGERLTFDFTGYLKVRARFAEDMMSFDTFYNLIATTGIQIQGLLNSNWAG